MYTQYTRLLEFYVDYHGSHFDGVEDDGLWLFAGQPEDNF